VRRTPPARTTRHGTGRSTVPDVLAAQLDIVLRSIPGSNQDPEVAATLRIAERALEGGRRLGAAELAYGLVELLGLLEVADVTGLRDHDELRVGYRVLELECDAER